MTETTPQRALRRLFPAEWTATHDRIRSALNGRPRAAKPGPDQKPADARAATYLEAAGHPEAAAVLRARSRTSPRAWWTERRVRVLDLLADVAADVPTGEHASLEVAATVIAVSRLAAWVGLSLWARAPAVEPARALALQRAAVAFLEELLRAEVSSFSSNRSSASMRSTRPSSRSRIRELTAAERNVIETAERWHDGCSAADVDALVDSVVRLRGVRR